MRFGSQKGATPSAPRRDSTGSGHRPNPVWSLVFGFVLASPLAASPHVVGYERFHADAPTAEGGEILFSELGCASCHEGGDAVVPRQGPNLINLKDRVSREWVADFLKEPESARAGSTMPAMLHDFAEDEVDSVVAYLGSLGKGLKLKTERYVNAERGSALYHEKGCIACHEPTADYRSPHAEAADFDAALAIAHPNLPEKTSLDALTHFLTNTATYRPDGRMPDFQLAPQEALDIAAHLLDLQTSDPREAARVKAWPESDPEKVAAGRAIVEKQNCAACHDLPGLTAAPSVPVDAVESHCLSETPGESVPHYDLTEAQRASLVAYLTKPVTSEMITLAAMNCYACHERDSIGGPTNATNPYFVGDESLADSGRIPPPLTHIGYKLKPEWMEKVFAGSEDHRVRPYLKTEMPAYAGHAAALTEWLGELDARPDATPLTIHPDDTEVGQQLLGIVGGVNCITCHNWGEQASLGIPALDISALDERLQPEWFREYLLDPAWYRPGTLMPPLWPGGNSTLPGVLDGDTERQIGAIWAFIKDGQGAPTGFPDLTGGRFELTPTDRPIIQRTFFEGTGSKAILVGFPGGISLAYDGSTGQPSLAWRGRFIDAYNTWYVRKAPFESPLGESVVSFPKSEKVARYLGFVLDEDGNPTFLSRVGEEECEDSFRAEGETLVRSVTAGFEVRHPDGVTIEQDDSGGTQIFRYTWK